MFNQTLDELHREHARYDIADPDLRSDMISRVTQMVLPKYEEFLDK